MAGKFTRFSEKRDTQSGDVSSYDDAVDAIEPDESSGLHIPIAEENIGFKLIQKMGWSSGTGLGRKEQGRVDPVPLFRKDDNMGLGRFQMELDHANKVTEKRKQLEIEKELTSELIGKYKEQVEKESEIAEATADLRKSYYCESCDKQYFKYSEYDNHLNSYDHHHRQRLRDLRQRESGRRFRGHKSGEEQQQKIAAAHIVAIERAEMTVKRYLEGDNAPGFKPIGAGKTAKVQRSLVTVGTSSQSRQPKTSSEMTDSEVKIAEKKAKLAKYGVKFQSAGQLMSIRDQEESLTSYQSLVLNSTPTASTKSSSAATKPVHDPSNPFARHFVAAGHFEESGEKLEDKKKELSDQLKVVGATKRKLQELEKKTEEEDVSEADKNSDSGGEDFAAKKPKSSTASTPAGPPTDSKKIVMGGKFKIKLTGERYESFYY